VGRPPRDGRPPGDLTPRREGPDDQERRVTELVIIADDLTGAADGAAL